MFRGYETFFGIPCDVCGMENLISHPRFYWGESGNPDFKPLFTLYRQVPGSDYSMAMGSLGRAVGFFMM